jgi:hypothetical protein
MPVDLHERLSEFSYGYGVTREAEAALASVGLRAIPFLPNLLHEAELGFDVGFDRPGAPLLLQFKLGQAMKRFVPGPGPHLNRPYWRVKRRAIGTPYRRPKGPPSFMALRGGEARSRA